MSTVTTTAREREVIEGRGVVTFYNPRRYDRVQQRPGGYGFLHRSDAKCRSKPGECRDREHRVFFTVFEVQWVGIQNVYCGTELAFKASPAKKEGDSPRAFRLELMTERRERPSKLPDVSVTHSR